jgi:hypothetical protein
MSRCSAANLPNKPPRWVERRPSHLDMFKPGYGGCNPAPHMSALGQKRTFSAVCAMSALPPIADKSRQGAPQQKVLFD